MRTDPKVVLARQRLAALAALLVAPWFAGCGGGDSATPTGLSSTSFGSREFLESLVVSDPIAEPGALSAKGIRTLSVDDDSVSYVSFSPGTLLEGDRVRIVNQAKAFSTTYTIVDGGLDPVPVPASVGDTLEIDVLQGRTVLLGLPFAVPDRRSPVVVRTRPPRGKTDVPLNESILVVFSEPVESATVASETVRLLEAGSAIPGTLTVSAGGIEAIFAPEAPLAPATNYILDVATGITDRSGEALDAAVRVPFTTEAAPSATVSFTSIQAGTNHTCGVTTEDLVYCWGSNGSDSGSPGAVADGRLGIGNTALLGSEIPLRVAGGERFSEVDVGLNLSCGVSSSREVYCWGNAIGGIPEALPLEAWLDRSTILSAAAPSPLVVNGGGSSCALGENREVYCVFLGPSLYISRDSQWIFLPLGAAEERTLVDNYSVGYDFICATVATGQAFCGGINHRGQLGNGTTGNTEEFVDPFAMTAVQGGLSFRALAAGRVHACGITLSGETYCWGGNSFGQLGDAAGNDRAVPGLLGGGLTFETISAGDMHSCGLTAIGEAYCWGGAFSGQIGNGSQGSFGVFAPTRVAGDFTFQSISAGGSHTCGVTTSGRGYCWGSNTWGQLGNGRLGILSGVPVPVANP